MTVRALLFTDLVDSTRMVERLGDARAAEVWAEHDRRSRDLLPRYRGREIGRSDGFFLLFDEPGDAARYALAYHQTLAELGLNARAGLHVGPVILRDNTPADIARGAISTEVEGLATPLTARIMALAGVGQTLVSRAARDALAAKLPEGAEMESHGHYRLKGVEEPVEIFEIGVRGASPFLPPVDVEKAYRVVRVADMWRPLRQVHHTLPAERDVFIGRTKELRAIAARLDAGTRLLTVLGPGGTGKTRVVRRYGWTWLGDWPGGVFFADLSEARSLDGIFFAVASALDVPLGKADPATRLGHAIAGRGRCLVILDNFEQVAEHAVATLGDWLDRAADAAFIVTSRERLHLAGEESLPIEPLPLDVEAIDLFAARARAQRPDFAVNDANRAAVAEVVRLLDGLPLAIELAAARIRVLSPAQLVDRMRDRFSLLAGARGAAARQATLRAAIDWSWDLLTNWEQTAFAQCSTFEGGFTLEAAEAVLDLSAWPDAPSAMDAVQALVDKSLLRTWAREQSGRFDIQELYFGMYISIHEYAAEKLRTSGETAARATETRHGGYFARFGTDQAIEALFRHEGEARRRALVLELDNLVAACRRAAGRADGEAAVATYRAIWEVLELRGPFNLGTVLGSQVLAIETVDASLRAAALLTRARVARRVGRMQEAATYLEQAQTLAREAGDRHREASVLTSTGILLRELGRTKESLAHYEQAVAAYREVGDRHAEGGVLGNLGNLHAEQGMMQEAREYFEQALAHHRSEGNHVYQGVVLNNLGNVNLEQGRTDDARSCYEQALAIHREVGNRPEEGIALGNLGRLYHDLGQMTEAAGYGEAALAIAREIGDRRFEGFALGLLGNVYEDQSRTEEARTYWAQALAIHRAVGNRRLEGATLASLGDLLARQGLVGEAREAFATGEALLRLVNDRLALGTLLCFHGRAEVAVGEIDVGRAKLADAETVATAMGAGPDSALGREIAKLRELL